MYIVFDTEAKDISDDYKKNGVSYLSAYRSDTGEIVGFFENELDKFFELFEKCDEIIGYNIIGYDFPVVEEYRKLNLSGKKVVDLMKIIADKHKIYLKLDNIAQTTIGGAKIAHGLDAVRFYKQGDLDKLKAYCDMDVELTHKVYLFIKENGYILYTDGVGKEVKLEVTLEGNNQPITEPKENTDDLFSNDGGLF